MSELSPNNSGLVGAVEEVLEEGHELLRTIGTGAYTWKDDGGCGASIGMHYRHVLEHFQCLLEGVAGGRINYDERRRSSDLENSPETALAATESLIAGFRDLGEEVLLGECAVVYSVGYSAGGTQEVRSSVARSTVAREVMFCVGHATHHYALMKPQCSQMGIRVPYEFGVAPSTLKHLETHQGR